MQTAEETRVVKLSNHARNGEIGLIAELNNSQFGRLERTRIDNGFGGNFDSRDSYDPFLSGYIDPNNVRGYYLDGEKTILGSPELKVWIGIKERWDDGVYQRKAGYYEFSVDEGDSEKIILYGDVGKKDVLEKRISVEYVVEDYSGIILPITRDKVVDNFNDARARYDDGSNVDFKQLEGLVRASGFDFDSELANLKVYGEQKAIERYSCVENLEKVLYRFEERGFYFEDGQIDDETYGKFIDMVGKINFPNDCLKDRAIKLLNKFSECYALHAYVKEKDLEEDIENRRKEIDKMSNEATLLSWRRRKLQGEDIPFDL